MMHIADDARFVNGQSTDSQAPQQPKTLDQIAQENCDLGVWLLCKEALVNAIQDRRLDRLHLRVLATIALCINSKTAKAWPSRQLIADKLGVEPVTVSNKLRELRLMGYLVGERQRVPEADNRSLMVYTFGNLDRETIIRGITEWAERMQAARKTPKAALAAKVTEASDSQQKSPQSVTLKVTEAGDSCAKVTEYGGRKSPSTVDSNYEKKTTKLDLAAITKIAQATCDELLNKYPDVFVVARWPSLQIAADFIDWIEKGCDVERDIKPAVEAVALQQRSQRRTISTWRYVRDAVFRRKLDREAGVPLPASSAPVAKSAGKLDKMIANLSAADRALLEGGNA